MNAIKKFLVTIISGLALSGCFDMTEHPYTLLDASNYFTDENSVKQVVAHIYAQEQSDLSELYWYAQELSADQITWRSWNGGSWGWDSGDKFVLSTHTWNPSSNYVNQIWSKAWTAIGLCNNFITDLSNINASTLGISEAQKQAYIDEVRTFRVYCYYNVFEVFGSVIPLTTSTDTSVLPVSAMNGMTFEEGNAKICDWMIEELDGALESLEINGSVNRCNQAMNRMIKMRILLNSEVFTGQPRFDECKLLAKDIIDGKNIAAGDVLIGVESSGVHSNGFSLVRRVLDVENADIKTPLEKLGGKSIGEALLAPTKIYVKPMLALFEEVTVKAVSHITGGGFYENIPRSIPKGFGAKINKDALRIPAIFSLIMEQGNIPERDMFNTFNMGVGMSVVVAKEDAEKAIEILKANGEDAYIMGEIIASEEGVVIE